ncbi:MAG: AsmA family protein [Sphingobacteriales bacterium]|nr:MAG: AsmA family protein [Sphingobacteriales bacterium]
MLPEEDFDFPSFLGFNADVHYSADKVNADKLPIDSMNMTFRVKDGRLHLVPLVVGAGGGTVRMDLHLVDTPGEMPVHGHIKLDIHRVSVARLLHPFDFAAGSAGLISGHGQFRSSGESVAAMLGSLNGEASLAMPNGQLNASLVELAGLDGGEALLLALEKEQTVDVNCAYIGATVRNGKLGIDTGLVDTTDTKFTMDGMIDFGKERLDLQILAHPKDASLFAVRAPLILEGTFRNPDFHPSWASLFARGAAALALGAIAPPAALLAFVEPGLGEGGAPCRKHLAHGLPVQHQ